MHSNCQGLYLFGEQKVSMNFNLGKQEGIDSTKLLKMTLCRALEAWKKKTFSKINFRPRIKNFRSKMSAKLYTVATSGQINETIPNMIWQGMR